MGRIAGWAAGIWAAVAAPAAAHPHLFIDTGLHAIFDAEGRLAAIRVIWAYDELYSLLALEDRGLDPDFDGVLTEEELASLDGFDMNWEPDFNGDIVATLGQGGPRLELSRPIEHATAMQDGRIVTVHTRAVEPRPQVAETPVVFRIYDPTFFTAYTVTVPTRIEGREGCAGRLYRPDLDAAEEQLLAALAELGPTDTLEEAGFPEVGHLFAEEIRLTCAS